LEQARDNKWKPFKRSPAWSALMAAVLRRMASEFNTAVRGGSCLSMILLLLVVGVVRGCSKTMNIKNCEYEWFWN
jgi:hypothetical protein